MPSELDKPSENPYIAPVADCQPGIVRHSFLRNNARCIARLTIAWASPIVVKFADWKFLNPVGLYSLYVLELFIAGFVNGFFLSRWLGSSTPSRVWVAYGLGVFTFTVPMMVGSWNQFMVVLTIVLGASFLGILLMIGDRLGIVTRELVTTR